MVMGCHALFSIGKELNILKDYPEESESLREEIKKADVFFDKQGLDFRKKK